LVALDDVEFIRFEVLGVQLHVEIEALDLRVPEIGIDAGERQNEPDLDRLRRRRLDTEHETECTQRNRETFHHGLPKAHPKRILMAVSIVFKGKRLVQRDTATFDHMLKRRVSFVRFLEVDRNIDFPFSGADWDRMTRLSSEVVNLSPDSIVVHSNDFRAALLQNGRSVPTVFGQGG